jgi:hypothetical protein
VITHDRELGSSDCCVTVLGGLAMLRRQRCDRFWSTARWECPEAPISRSSGDTLPRVASPEVARLTRQLDQQDDTVSDTVLDIQETVDRHTGTLVTIQETVDQHTGTLVTIQETVDQHTETLATIQETQAQHGGLLAEILRRLDNDPS